MRNIAIGKWGEDYAAEHLRKKGYVILERNYRTKGGELDIIARQRRKLFGAERQLVFFEVKTMRRHDAEGFLPEDNVHQKKQQQLIRAARLYLYEKGIAEDTDWQIDVLAVEIDARRRAVSIRHLSRAVGDIGSAKPRRF